MSTYAFLVKTNKQTKNAVRSVNIYWISWNQTPMFGFISIRNYELGSEHTGMVSAGLKIIHVVALG